MRARQGGVGPNDPSPELFDPAVVPSPTDLQQRPSRGSEPAPGAVPDSAIAVDTLTAIIRDIVEGAFPPLWVRGEVSGFKRHAKSGHWYFTLRGDDAVIRCVMWQQDARRMPATPDEGMAVLALGAIRVFPKAGEVQFVVRRLKDVGDGMWRKVFEQTRQRLDADGLLAPGRKRALPLLPRRIAVITSQDGAAWPDIVTVVRKRCPMVDLVLIPATVQGDDAPRSLCRALSRLTKWGGADLVIFGRGGGSREDLWAFNDERVARRLAACPIPTISAVGHQIDTTICDLVADRRAATPSAAAEMAVPELDELRRYIVDCGHALQRRVTGLASLGSTRLVSVAERLHARAAHVVEKRRLRLDAYAGRLHALSPLATLGRGYAAVFSPGGTPITDALGVSVGDLVRVRMRDGSFGARVESAQTGESP